nr:FAD-dependent oxidoreductase [Desulfoferrobacter suflitae]
MPYYVGKVVDDVASLIARTPEEFQEKHDIQVKTLHEVIELDIRRQQVRVRDLQSTREWLEPYDQLLIATGASALKPNIPGIDAHGVLSINSLQSGIEARRLVDDREPRRAVIVGGGYIGLEMAEALLLRGIEVALVERSPQVMGTLDLDMGALVSAALRRQGATLYLEEAVAGFDQKNGWVQAVVTNQRTIPADVVILGMGVAPNSALADEAGMTLGQKKAIKVSKRMQTEIENVWAAGDCAESFHLVTGKPFYVALGTVANKHGRVAGENIAGGNAEFAGVVGTAVTKVCSVEVARTGLQIKEITEQHIEFADAVIESTTRAGYYPESGPITVKLLAEKGSGRLLGGQIVGCEGAAKRIDIIATALHAGFTAEQVSGLDLSYAPPYSPLWDPVLIAARQLAKKL